MTYQHWQHSESALLRAAAKIYAQRTALSALSPLVLMSDPAVHSDVCGAARRAPKGCAVIYRHFGAQDRMHIARRLRQITFARQQQFLIGNDPAMCSAVGADGVHFTRSASLVASALWRRRCPDWLITAAGIKGDYLGYTGDISVLDAIFISSVFGSSSKSAGVPIGAARVHKIARALDVPVAALGGITDITAGALTGTDVSSLAGRFVF